MTPAELLRWVPSLSEKPWDCLRRSHTAVHQFSRGQGLWLVHGAALQSKRLNSFWSRTFVHSCDRPHPTTAVGISAPCCTAYCRLNFTASVQCSLKESSMHGSRVRGGCNCKATCFGRLSEAEIKPSGWHRRDLAAWAAAPQPRQSCKSFCAHPATQGSQGAMLCHQALCLSSAIHARSQLYIIAFCRYPCWCLICLRFFGNTCKRVNTYFVLSVILNWCCA